MFDKDNGEITSLTKAGLVFLVFLTIAIITYALLSPIMTSIFNAFDASDFSNAETQKDTYLPLISQCCTVFFAIFISLPMTWFIFWVFHREPRYNEYDWRK